MQFGVTTSKRGFRLGGTSSDKASRALEAEGFVPVFVLTVLNLVPAVLVPILAEHFRLLTTAESVLLGVLIMILLTSAEILYHVNWLRRQGKRELLLWNVEDAFDNRLSNIRQAFRKLLSDRRDMPDLFQSFFEDKVAEVEKSIVEAAGRDELHLERSHVVSVGVLLGSFQGEETDILRAVHFFADNDFFFDVYAKQYFYHVYELVQEGKIREVRRLMIYTQDEELRDPKSIRLMKFHCAVPRYSCRCVRLQDFRTLSRDCGLDVPRDFGIYGDKYVYCAQTNLVDNIVGYWLRNPRTVGLYIRFFDLCWNSPVASVPRSLDRTTITSLDGLYQSQ